MSFYTEQARREGVSRNTVLVRVLTDRARQGREGPLTVAELRASAERARDLDDAAVMDADGS